MPLTQDASRNQQRMGLTHVGIICNIPAVQRLLPQVLIVPSRYLLLRDLPAVRAAMPPTISVVRAKSKWISKAVMVWIVRLLAWTLRPLRRKYHVALLMDVLGIHIDTSVTDAAREAGIDLLYVPALLTWLSQPCDTHAFSLYKRHLRRLFLSFRSRGGLGLPTVVEWLLLIRDTIVSFLNVRPWMRAFIEDGFSRDQAGVSDYIRSHLPPGYALPLPSTPPSDAQLRLVFPKTRINLNFAAFRTPPAKASLPLPASSSGALPLPLPPPVPPPNVRRFALCCESAHTASLAKPAMPIMIAKAKAVHGPKAKSRVGVPRAKFAAQVAAGSSRVLPKAPVRARRSS
jgi:hypothetical protein